MATMTVDPTIRRSGGVRAHSDPRGWALSVNASSSGVDAQFSEIREWTRFYVFESFKVRPAYLGSIESHPDFE